MRAALVLIALALAACGVRASAPAVLPARPTAVSTTPLAQLEASLDLDRVAVGRAEGPTVVMLLASWCSHCRAELAIFDHLRATHPQVRWLGLNYKGHEEYDGRGSSVAIRALANDHPWLQIVPANDALFAAFGSPPRVPTIWIYDRAGYLVATFDRRERPAPDADELAALLHTLD